MKNRLFIFIIISIILSSLVLAYAFAPKKTNWEYSFSKKSKIPFGSYLLYSLLPSIFPQSTILDSHKSVYYLLKDNDFKKTNYIAISNSLNFDEYDFKELEKFVKKGNNVFLSFIFLNYDVLKKLDIEMEYNSSAESKNIYYYKDIKYNVVSAKSFNYFKKYNKEKVHVLAWIDTDKPVFIKIKYGKGSFYLYTLPQTLGNYEFVKNKNNDYLYRIFSNMPDYDVVWDEYYKPGNIVKIDPMVYIKNNEELRKVYYIVIFIVLIAVIFGIKREQKIIPVKEIKQNKIMKFIKDSGAFVFQNKNNKQLAKNKIEYFYHYLSKMVYIDVYHLKNDNSFSKVLSEKTNLSEKNINSLLRSINEVFNKNKVSDKLLMELDNQILEIKKHIEGR